MERKNAKTRMKAGAVAALASALALPACSTMETVFATGKKKDNAPIANPFLGYDGQALDGGAGAQGTVFRTRRGDQSFEVTFPEQGGKLDEVSMPTRALAADDVVPADDPYRNRKPAMADREIAETFPKAAGETDADRGDIERTLGMMPSSDETPRGDRSYLAGIDRVKRLYREARFEAALLEVEDLLVDFPTSPKLYEMRGTLLDRMGKRDLAMRSWEQALRLEPKNVALKRYIERKRVTRGLAGGER